MHILYALFIILKWIRYIQISSLALLSSNTIYKCRIVFWHVWNVPIWQCKTYKIIWCFVFSRLRSEMLASSYGDSMPCLHNELFNLMEEFSNWWINNSNILLHPVTNQYAYWKIFLIMNACLLHEFVMLKMKERYIQ